MAATFTEALKFRYLEGYIDKDDVKRYTVEENLSTLIIGKVGGKEVEFISNDTNDYSLDNSGHNEDHISRYCQCICLVNFNISRIDLNDENIDNYQYINDAIEIDLTNNLLSDWKHAEILISRFSQLSVLNLSHNPLRVTCLDANLVHSGLRILNLNYTKVSWNQAIQIGKCFPNLEELHLCYNDIDDITIDLKLDCFLKLCYLNLEGNHIKSWTQLKSLLDFKSLVKLSLSNNPIDKIDENIVFEGIASLSLNGCPLSSWDDVLKLLLFPKLEELYILNNKLPSASDKFKRWTTLAILFHLKRLNGSPISTKEKEEAIQFYIQQTIKRYKSDNLETIKNTDTPFKRICENYEEEAIKVYNKFHSIAEQKESPSNNSMVHVILKTIEGDKSFKKRLPLSTNISRLQLLASALFKCQGKAIHFFLEEIDPDSNEISKKKITSSIDTLGDYTTNNKITLTFICEYE